MQYFLFGLLALALVLLAMRGFVIANPTVLARRVRMAGALTALGGAAVLALRGNGQIAFWVGLLGVWLLVGGQAGWPRGWSGRSSPGNASRVVTDHLDIELDHDTGAIRGQILRGFFAGRDLETLRPVELAHLWSDCRFSDPQSAQVLEAYLDRVHPTWRDDMARTGGSEDGARAAVEPQTMTREAALDILGLGPEASEDDIRRAHRELMLKLHPDRGGSHTLAAAVNMAKEVLLGRG